MHVARQVAGVRRVRGVVSRASGEWLASGLSAPALVVIIDDRESILDNELGADIVGELMGWSGLVQTPDLANDLVE